MNNIRIAHKDMLLLTDVEQERNIYVHPNRLARDIFWQRLETLVKFIEKHADPSGPTLDMGGGSGALLPGLSRFFDTLRIIDLDAQDARNIAAHFKLENVTIDEIDLFTHHPKTPYQTVIMADVLEHFSDLNRPCDWLWDNMAPGGKLFVSLPTENWLYRLGRSIVRKTKPDDHYHTAKHVIASLRGKGFRHLYRRHAPRYFLPIPLFLVAMFERP